MGKSQSQATLLDVLIDGFEKNEILSGFHWRQPVMPGWEGDPFALYEWIEP